MQAIIGRHERIALQFSGGRDSIACLYLMRDYWDRLTVYWLNTGSAFPETVQLAAEVRAMVPHFVEIAGRQPDVVEAFGLPSDLVPATRTPIGIVGTGDDGMMIQDRYACCFRSIMVPLHERMIADGITLIIRGQKSADRHKSIVRSGDVENGIEYLFPLEDRSDSDVMDYLKREGAPIPRFYEVMDSAPDCMTCSAWWENGAAKYLKRYHHPEFLEVQRRLDVINVAVSGHIASFNKEVSA